jgi:hypothetical protein
MRVNALISEQSASVQPMTTGGVSEVNTIRSEAPIAAFKRKPASMRRTFKGWHVTPANADLALVAPGCALVKFSPVRALCRPSESAAISRSCSRPRASSATRVDEAVRTLPRESRASSVMDTPEGSSSPSSSLACGHHSRDQAILRSPSFFEERC